MPALLGIRVGVVCLAALAGGCSTGPQWSQFQGNAANTGEVFAATYPAGISQYRRIPTGHLGFSSAVIGPDGKVYYTISGNSLGITPGHFRFATDTPGPLTRDNTASSFSSTQASTPALDSVGWSYVSYFASKEKGSKVFAQTSVMEGGAIIDVDGVATAPAKVLEVVGGRLIFIPFLGKVPVGQHILVINNLSAGDRITYIPRKILDQWVCDVVEGGLELGFNFRVRGIDLGPPGPEAPAVAIRTIESARGSEIYMVIASDRCGITAYRVELAATQTDAPKLVPIWGHIIDRWFSSPVIAADGTVIVSDSGQTTTAYSIFTGDKRWEVKSDSYVGAAPALAPLQIPSVYIASSTNLAKHDLVTGALQASTGFSGQSSASPVVGGNYVYMSTSQELSIFDLDLNPVLTLPMAGGVASPAINSKTGEVIVPATDGSIYVFPGR